MSSQLVVVFAIAKGVAEAEATLWLDQLDQADREGRFGFDSVPVLSTAVAV